MVECDACLEWYHNDCLGKSKAELDALDHFYCDMCGTSGADVLFACSVDIFRGWGCPPLPSKVALLHLRCVCLCVCI